MSETGFFHPSRGYWQTTGTPSEAVLAGYPEGTVQVPLKPGADHQWINGAWVYVAPPAAVPFQITKVQFVRAMRALHVGNDPLQPTLWAAHGATIEAHPDWPYITVLPRFDTLTLAAAAVIPASPPEMDAIWQLGATL
jgi:hypothetical protein